MILISHIIIDLKLIIRGWRSLILFILLPVFFAGITGLSLKPLLEKSSFIESFDIAITDNDNNLYTNSVIGQMQNITLFRKIVRTDEKTGVKLLAEGKISALIVFPQGLYKSVYDGKNKNIRIFTDDSNPVRSALVRNLANSSVNLITAGQSVVYTVCEFCSRLGIKGKQLDEIYKKSIYYTVNNAIARNSYFETTVFNRDGPSDPFRYYTLTILSIFIMLSGMPAARMIISLRNMNLGRRLLSTPSRIRYPVISKILVTVLLGVFQFIITLFIAEMFFKTGIWPVSLKTILVLLSAMPLSASFSVLTGILANKYGTAALVIYLTVFLSALTGGCIYPLFSLPEIIQNISDISPVRWIFTGINASLVKKGDVLPQIMIISISALLFLVLSVILFRKQTFGQGKAESL